MRSRNEEMAVRSPAKINLALNVLGRRDDGYHEVETVYQMVKFGDVLRIRPRTHGVTISSTHPDVPCGQDNLVSKAASALSSHCRVPIGAHILIEKHIPIAAGLGGGSSNAAAALRALNALCRLGVGEDELLEIARTLGADVPFFLKGPTALGTGRGDLLVPLRPGWRAWVLLVCPDIKLSTRQVYEKLNSQLTAHSYDISILLRALQGRELAGIGDFLHNDLEAVSIAQHPVIGVAKDNLIKLGAEGALMSGSGPTAFGLFQDRADMTRAREALQNPSWRVIETETLTDLGQWDAEGTSVAGSSPAVS